MPAKSIIVGDPFATVSHGLLPAWVLSWRCTVMCAQVTRGDTSALRLNAWDRTLADWLQRADEANHEAAVEAKRNHTHRVHSVLGGKSILTDKEITMPEDDLASQVPS